MKRCVGPLGLEQRRKPPKTIVLEIRHTLIRKKELRRNAVGRCIRVVVGSCREFFFLLFLIFPSSSHKRHCKSEYSSCRQIFTFVSKKTSVLVYQQIAGLVVPIFAIYAVLNFWELVVPIFAIYAVLWGFSRTNCKVGWKRAVDPVRWTVDEIRSLQVGSMLSEALLPLLAMSQQPQKTSAIFSALCGAVFLFKTPLSFSSPAPGVRLNSASCGANDAVTDVTPRQQQHVSTRIASANSGLQLGRRSGEEQRTSRWIFFGLRCVFDSGA